MRMPLPPADGVRKTIFLTLESASFIGIVVPSLSMAALAALEELIIAGSISSAAVAEEGIAGGSVRIAGAVAGVRELCISGRVPPAVSKTKIT